MKWPTAGLVATGVRLVDERRAMRIKLVGPCASGKSILASRLRGLGYEASTAAQDHSFVPDMWQRLNPPDVLIYLDVTLEAAHRRGRVGTGWNQDYLDEQHWRLRHARKHCDLYLPTSDLAEEEVLAEILSFLRQWAERAPLARK